ncbi:MAG: hypothetical protein NUV83_01715 [Candidatus Wolfebacteria bacterium]|nr:hypothetical protein [Candidatus Wolfebacteria bacterium]
MKLLDFLKKIFLFRFFDKLEDKIRGKLSHHPVIYAMIGSVGIILLWRGIWIIADNYNMSGLVSVILGAAILLATGLFVSFFVGDRVIISGIKEEKRIDEKTEEEIKKETEEIKEIKTELKEIGKDIEELKNK